VRYEPRRDPDALLDVPIANPALDHQSRRFESTHDLSARQAVGGDVPSLLSGCPGCYTTLNGRLPSKELVDRPSGDGRVSQDANSFSKGNEFRQRLVRAFFHHLVAMRLWALRSPSALILEAIELLLKKRSTPSIEKNNKKSRWRCCDPMFQAQAEYIFDSTAKYLRQHRKISPRAGHHTTS
jgi:hypothetical protein